MDISEQYKDLTAKINDNLPYDTIPSSVSPHSKRDT